jgi:putative ABC transport system substrate-binding protein
LRISNQPFAAVTDPMGLGIVQSLAHPGGNATGFLTAEFGFGAKWLELLNEIAPGVRRVVVITEQNNPSATAQFAAVQTVASSAGVELRLVGSRDDNSIERASVTLYVPATVVLLRSGLPR